MINVLILEDDSVQAKFLTLKLQQRNYNVICCRTYDAAIEAINVESFDYYFIDINLGKQKTGIDFIEIIRSKTIKPIFITSDFKITLELHTKLSRMLGFNTIDISQEFESSDIYFFVKPIQYDRLFVLLDKYENK